MEHLLFTQVKETVVHLLRKKHELFEEAKIVLEVIENSDNCLYVLLKFQKCMAAIVGAESGYTPYRFVSFEAVDVINGSYSMVHAWYDDEGMTMEDVVKNLDEAIRIASQYCALHSPDVF